MHILIFLLRFRKFNDQLGKCLGFFKSRDFLLDFQGRWSRKCHQFLDLRHIFSRYTQKIFRGMLKKSLKKLQKFEKTERHTTVIIISPAFSKVQGRDSSTLQTSFNLLFYRNYLSDRHRIPCFPPFATLLAMSIALNTGLQKRRNIFSRIDIFTVNPDKNINHVLLIFDFLGHFWKSL